MPLVVEILLHLTLGLWVFLFLGRTIAALSVARLEDQTPPDPEVWPSLSVVIPACNEEATLAEAVRTLLAQPVSA